MEELKNKNCKLLKFNIIKSRILNKKHYANGITLEDTEIRLKKALKLIYSYHIQNKRILFVGNPLSINNELTTLLKNTKHIFIPKSAWIAGIITNQHFSFKSVFKKENSINTISQRLLKLKKKSNLVVIIDKVLDEEALKESYYSRLPIISLNNNLNIFEVESSYKVPGNYSVFKNQMRNNFFYSLLISTIKKAQKIKQNFPSLSHKMLTLSVFKKKQQYRKKVR